jgi:hypothetical protein
MRHADLNDITVSAITASLLAVGDDQSWRNLGYDRPADFHSLSLQRYLELSSQTFATWRDTATERARYFSDVLDLASVRKVPPNHVARAHHAIGQIWKSFVQNVQNFEIPRRLQTVQDYRKIYPLRNVKFACELASDNLQRCVALGAAGGEWALKSMAELQALQQIIKKK